MADPTTEPRGGPRTVRPTRPQTIAPRVRPRAGLHAVPALDAVAAEDDASPRMTPVPVTWGDHTVDAPGFDQDRFERAMTRAFIDDLRVRPISRKQFLVFRPGATFGHRVTRTTCTCPAGEHDVPCKHRAVVIAHLDIREPELARRWARRARRREREMLALDAA